jgi:hypothetical protein
MDLNWLCESFNFTRHAETFACVDDLKTQCGSSVGIHQQANERFDETRLRSCQETEETGGR